MTTDAVQREPRPNRHTYTRLHRTKQRMIYICMYTSNITAAMKQQKRDIFIAAYSRSSGESLITPASSAARVIDSLIDSLTGSLNHQLTHCLCFHHCGFQQHTLMADTVRFKRVTLYAGKSAVRGSRDHFWIQHIQASWCRTGRA